MAVADPAILSPVPAAWAQPPARRPGGPPRRRSGLLARAGRIAADAALWEDAARRGAARKAAAAVYDAERRWAAAAGGPKPLASANSAAAFAAALLAHPLIAGRWPRRVRALLSSLGQGPAASSGAAGAGCPHAAGLEGVLAAHAPGEDWACLSEEMVLHDAAHFLAGPGHGAAYVRAALCLAEACRGRAHADLLACCYRIAVPAPASPRAAL